MKRTALKSVVMALGGLAVLAVSGCDLQEDADLDNGREQFTTQCGVCHILAEAGTTAVLGPDLDAAFADSRSQGFDSDTIEGVVEAQIGFPRETDVDDPTYMPADIVTGDDKRDVAAYVGSVAGIPGISGPEVPDGAGGQVFAANGCGSCHILAAAGSAGVIGPNLDEVLPGQSDAMIEESTVDPEATITSGFDSMVMPANYAEEITTEDLMLLVEFLAMSAGQDAADGNGSG